MIDSSDLGLVGFLGMEATMHDIRAEDIETLAAWIETHRQINTNGDGSWWLDSTAFTPKDTPESVAAEILREGDDGE